MPHDAESRKVKLVAGVVTQARKQAGKPEAKILARLVPRYFKHVPPDDIVGERPRVLLGLVRSHWSLGSTRTPGRARVRVYNPRDQRDGWHSPHTVVEIVNDDMPFLVDSVTAELNRQGLIVHLVIHPLLTVRRRRSGKRLELVEPDTTALASIDESYMHIQVSEQPDDRLEEIQAGVERVLADVRAAVEDWQPMRQKIWTVIEELQEGTGGHSVDEVSEVCAFLRWMHNNHFTFLGYRDYAFVGSGKRMTARVDDRTGLGVLRDADAIVFEQIGRHSSLPPDVGVFLRYPGLLMVTKTNKRCTVHRAVHMDSIGIKRLDPRGRVVGQRLFVGLFTSVAYSRSPREIPLLRQKLERTVQRAGFPEASHDGKALMHILETFPRDELFQVSDEHLFRTSMGILHLQERQRVTLFLRRDEFERFVSCLVYIPRDRYNTELCERIQDILAESLGGRVAAFQTEFGESPLPRLYIIVSVPGRRIPDYDAAEIEARLVAASRSWTDHLRDALVSRQGELHGLGLLGRYGDAFGPGYRAANEAGAALADIDELESVLETGGIALNLYRPATASADQVRFKIYHPDRPVPLSDVLPVFEHMGFRVVDEVPHEVEPATDTRRRVIIQDFGLESRDGEPVDVAAIRDNLHDTFRRVWSGDVESDGFNALVTYGGLTWREVVLIRAYCKFLRQAGIPFSQTYMEQTLGRNPDLTRKIVDLFVTLFDPRRAKQAAGRLDRLRKDLADDLDRIVSADEDRILRRFVNLVESTLRTNVFQTTETGDPKPYISLKFDSERLDELPLPRPFHEIFVYSPKVEGVHLRFGMVARGGIRWSDRPEDFRTEVLSLVKAQQVKNAVIVPVGAKGGFVVKRPPAGGDREAVLAEGVASYRTFISGLLDITDSYAGSRVKPPPRVVRLDGDDPYLVVAADKGTATFSDYANALSETYDHWLGDAFASGGSRGYDHKGMAITARGVWECVKRHFREVGVDCQEEGFTVVGVGDMSGDVFGNGMLLSKHIKLRAAFNHLHIFVDPDPDPAKSWAERKRLFDTPRSTWADYSKTVLSAGGAVFERSAKSLALAPEVKRLSGLSRDTVQPNELIKALLKAEVDMLWFGGIGTYIKSGSEPHGEVGDRANDPIRIDAHEVGARIIGEGANLGLTQLGRTEFALKGGRVNTDAIDSSGGVDCSDHEVNIKILLDAEVQEGRLGQKRRNELLVKMTEEVAELVLKHNYLQSQAVTLVFAKGMNVLDNQLRLMRLLEKGGRLDRTVEYLPDDDTVAERDATKLGLTRPEICVLMSYSKIWLYDEILRSDVPDDPYMEDDLVQYFPTPLRTRFADAIRRHRLRREIIATRLTNSLVNRVGETFVTEIMEKTGRGPAEIARAYTIGRQVFALRELWDAIEKLDNTVPTSTQTSMLLDINQVIEWVSLWFLRNGRPGLDVGSHIREFREGIANLAPSINETLPSHYLTDAYRRAEPYVNAGVPKELALRVASLVNLYSGCDIVRLASRRKLPVPLVARMYFAIGTRFKLGRLRAATNRMSSDNHWQQLAVAAQIEEIYSHHLDLASQVLNFVDGSRDSETAIHAWTESHRDDVEAMDALLNELWASEVNDLAMVAVVSWQLRTMTSAKPA